MDVFLASVACGAEQIRIEKKTALCIGAVCSGVLLFSLVCGKLIDGVVREKYAAYLCFAGLFLVGAYKLTEYGIRAYIRRHHFLCKQVKMKFSQLNFIISIYNNPAAADRDCSATMSVTEGICFALAMSVDGGHAPVIGVRRLLYEVIFNLCDNAIKYNVPDGAVKVQVSSENGISSVTVSDTGIGIAPEHQSRVFERFYRVDKSHSKASGGTGLGLSIVKHAVQYHHGDIRLTSKPGEGTVIRITFPAAAQ